MKKIETPIGTKFGRWTILGESITSGRHFVAKCECGTEREVDGAALRRGMTKSCGCLAREQAHVRMKRHGHSIGNETPEYRSWCCMKGRCLNADHEHFPHYGGRGITICDRWMSFDLFLADMGLKPTPKHTLERLDNNGNYEPGNVIWATHKQQCRNRRNSKFVTALGETLTVAEWSERLNISPKALYARLEMGWSDHDTITRPRRKLKRYAQ